MKQRVKKISRCNMVPQHPDKMDAETKARFNKWVAPKRYRMRLKFLTVKGGIKVPPSPIYIY